MISKQQRMACSSGILEYEKKYYIAAVYDKHTTLFQQ